MDKQRIQDFYPQEFHECFGCGARNPAGMCVTSHLEGDEVVTLWHPHQHMHLRGAANVLQGGVTAALIDEVAGAAAFVQGHRNKGLALGESPPFDFVTAYLNVNYVKPVYMDRPLHLRAKVTEAVRRKVRVSCTVYSGEEEAANSDALFILLEHIRTGPAR